MAQTALPGHQDVQSAVEWTQLSLAMAYDIRDLEQNLAWHYGATLMGLNVKVDKDGFFVILKARVKGVAVCHFTGGRTFADAIEAVLWEVAQKQVNFRPDKFG